MIESIPSKQSPTTPLSIHFSNVPSINAPPSSPPSIAFEISDNAFPPITTEMDLLNPQDLHVTDQIIDLEINRYCDPIINERDTQRIRWTHFRGRPIARRNNVGNNEFNNYFDRIFMEYLSRAPLRYLHHGESLEEYNRLRRGTRRMPNQAPNSPDDLPQVLPESTIPPPYL